MYTWKYPIRLSLQLIIKKTCFHLPGLASTSSKSMVGLRAATESAKHPPNESPTRYIGLLGLTECSLLMHFSTILIRSEFVKM
jgi:hypothetical protein